MKKLFQVLLILSLLTSVYLPATSVLAAPHNAEQELTFSQLGLESDLVLHGPYESGSIRFDLPATWQLQPGAKLAINVKSIVTGNASVTESTFSGATLEVYFNDRLQQTIPLLSNETTTYYVPIAPEALVSPNSGGWHELSFFLYSEFDCTLDFHKTVVTISTDSVASFPYEPTALSLDLRRLPWPIYMQHAGKSDPVTVVIPGAPTADELQAGLVVTGTLGRMTNGKLPLTMITADQVTDDLLAQSHLLLVGKPSAFSRFGALPYPVPLVNGLFSSPEVHEDDGVLQILPSPWNDARAILLVSGNTDSAVVKAAQTLSTLNIQTGITPDYSIISKVSPAPVVGVGGGDASLPPPSDFRLSDLGYFPVTATGMGTNWIDYQFTIPLGLVPAEVPYIDLGLSVSSLVDPKRSEGIVFLNDVQIASVPLTSESTNLITTRVNFPLSVLRSGTNILSVVFNLLPFDECSVFEFDSLWATIYADSVIHLPLTQVPESAFALQDLKNYPYPFAMDPSLSTTAFVLSKKDPASWLQASRVAYDLGARVAGSVLGFEAAFDGEVPDELRNMNLILIGEPKNLSIVSELKDAMPAHFENGSNIAIMDSQQVIYRIPDQKSLGYLQLFASPWSDQKAISGIFGTNPVGLVSAIDAILNSDTRETFSGDFVTMDGSQAHIVDTRTGTGMGNMVVALNPSISQNGTTEPSVVPGIQPSFVKSRQLILMGAIIIVGLIGVTVVLALWFRKRHQ